VAKVTVNVDGVMVFRWKNGMEVSIFE